MLLLIAIIAFLAIPGALALLTALVSGLIEGAVPPLGKTIAIDGASIRYVDEGTGPAIVLLHGLGGNMRHFTYALVDRLKARHRVIVLDRPGCGYSAKAQGAGAGLRDQAAVIAAFIDALGLNKPLVVGHSLGGALALAIAIHHPDSVGGLALVAPLSHPDGEVPPPFRRLAIASASRRWLTSWILAVPVNLLTGAAATRYVFDPDPVPVDFGARGGGFLALRPVNIRAASAELVALADDLPSMVEGYRDLALPVGILYGTRDNILDYRRQGEALAAAIGGACLELIEDGGHMPPIVKPERTALFIETVARRVETARSGDEFVARNAS